MIVKDINIKNHTYYFFDDIINVKDFDPNNIKIDKKSRKNIFIYYTGYVTIKKDLKIYSVNSVYLSFNKVNGYLNKEINGNKYLLMKEKKQIKKYGELWIKSRDLIRSINKTQMIMMKNIWKSNLVKMTVYL